MRKSVWIGALLAAGLCWAEGDAARGQIFYAHLFAKELGYNGAVFAKKHTEKEWAERFKNGAEGFIKEFGPQLGPEAKALVLSPHFQERIAPHLEAFVLFYAKDKPEVPVCDAQESLNP